MFPAIRSIRSTTPLAVTRLSITTTHTTISSSPPLPTPQPPSSLFRHSHVLPPPIAAPSPPRYHHSHVTK
ncbi:hypothetical protein Tco_1049073, partial [Tanacetum coccineum]